MHHALHLLLLTQFEHYLDRPSIFIITMYFFIHSPSIRLWYPYVLSRIMIVAMSL